MVEDGVVTVVFLVVTVLVVGIAVLVAGGVVVIGEADKDAGDEVVNGTLVVVLAT